MAFISAGGGAGGDNITYLAPNYNSEETYNTGDVVIYNSLSYKCLDDNVTGAWNSSKWERTYLVDETDTLPEDAISFVAPEYDSTQTYNTDDVVLHNGLTYKCSEDSVTGTWDSEKWEREYICNLNSNLANEFSFNLVVDYDSSSNANGTSKLTFQPGVFTKFKYVSNDSYLALSTYGGVNIQTNVIQNIETNKQLIFKSRSTTATTVTITLYA